MAGYLFLLQVLLFLAHNSAATVTTCLVSKTSLTIFKDEFYAHFIYAGASACVRPVSTLYPPRAPGYVTSSSCTLTKGPEASSPKVGDIEGFSIYTKQDYRFRDVNIKFNQTNKFLVARSASFNIFETAKFAIIGGAGYGEGAILSGSVTYVNVSRSGNNTVVFVKVNLYATTQLCIGFNLP